MGEPMVYRLSCVYYRPSTHLACPFNYTFLRFNLAYTPREAPFKVLVKLFLKAWFRKKLFVFLNVNIFHSNLA